MIRDYVLLLSWLCTVQGEIGKREKKKTQIIKLFNIQYKNKNPINKEKFKNIILF